MNDTICLKTGCQLEYGGLFYWGDLHQHPSGALIFNAVCNSRGDPAVQIPRSSVWPSITCHPDGVWERRGVFVLSKDFCIPNTVLRRHLEEAPHGGW